MIKRSLAVVLLAMISLISSAQTTFPYNGVRPKEVDVYAIVGATVYTTPDSKIDNATILVKNGAIEAVGDDLRIPPNAQVIDAKGKTIYASFIDLDSEYGMSKSQQTEGGPRMRGGSQMESSRKGAFGWNDAIKAEVSAANLFVPDEEAAKDLRQAGFGAVLSFSHDGIVRGSSCLVALGGKANKSLLLPSVGAHLSFNKGSSKQDYPSSLMGSIALLRQTYLDAKWYASGGNALESNLSLAAFNNLMKLPVFFEGLEKWSVLRADKIGDEFGQQFIIRAGNDSYQRIAEIKATNARLIVPLDFPEAYDLSDPLVSRMVELNELMHWEQAPFNCQRLFDAKIPFTITSASLNDRSVFLKNLRKAVQCGLPKAEALRALTVTPASWVGMEGKLGVIQQGATANFLVVKGDIFDEGVVTENWIQGERFILDQSAALAWNKSYTLKLPKHEYALKVTMDEGVKVKASTDIVKVNKEGKTDTTAVSLKVRAEGTLLTLTFQPEDDYYKGIIRMAGQAGDMKKISGMGEMPDGSLFEWTLLATNDSLAAGNTKRKEENGTTPTAANVSYPFTAFGRSALPKQENVLIKNATIWTCESEGIIEEGQVLIANGKIAAVGKVVDASKFPGIRIIDARGKHVTPGIIDEHSHIAVASVNEGTQASSAEVQEASVLWPEDIDIYRQLAGGVTAAQLLHGSANPIGGQSALIKLRWGQNAEGMLIDGAPGFIKFALGENVKQSNWGDQARERFPQTRMGVEQVYYDHFIRAKEYIAQRSSALALGKGKTVASPLFRRDLEMEAIAEILEKKRFITCHSYVQSEINMLMHVADSMGFSVNTFTHILEGYKVADKMKAHGANASTFSDWWAYKMEVQDAIPYNGALMWQQGLNVGFNSDNAEMAARLNQEAAKAVKYGNVPEQEALKFVTLNPAKMLHLDHRMGSLKVGKDADVVVWSAHPLSIYAQAEQTFIDGACFYSMEEDKQLQSAMQAERARLIQKMMASDGGAEGKQKPRFKEKRHFHCDTLDETSLGVDFQNSERQENEEHHH
jgi:imidazolonepropionase-like amidohydrolase